MPRFSLSFSRMVALALITSTALADIVVLKTGEKVEGKVISETDQQVTMEVKISAGVTDERIIPRAQVERHWFYRLYLLVALDKAKQALRGTMC